MRVYAGTDGTVLAQVPQNSHTLIEYPVIVDVDADGNAEIVFAANSEVHRCDAISGYTGYQAGIRVFRDTADNWVGTRPVWNQHTYHITNVRQDLRIPSAELPNWRRFDNFRQNSQSFDAPNLQPVDLAVDSGSCPPTLGLTVTVHNAGAASVGPGLAVTFYARRSERHLARPGDRAHDRGHRAGRQPGGQRGRRADGHRARPGHALLRPRRTTWATARARTTSATRRTTSPPVPTTALPSADAARAGRMATDPCRSSAPGAGSRWPPGSKHLADTGCRGQPLIPRTRPFVATSSLASSARAPPRGTGGPHASRIALLRRALSRLLGRR